MSEPSYEIKVTYKPQYQSIPWGAQIFRVTNGEMIHSHDGLSREEVVTAALDTIRRMNMTVMPETLYATEDGELVNA